MSGRSSKHDAKMSPVGHKDKAGSAYGARDALWTFTPSSRSGRLAFSMRTRRRISVARATAGLASVAILAVGARAEAANPPCTDAVNHPNPVFISGSTAAQAAFQALAD